MMLEVPLDCLRVLKKVWVSRGAELGGKAHNIHGVLANILEPDVDQGASALAVDTLSLVGANDDLNDDQHFRGFLSAQFCTYVRKSGAVLKNEHGVGLTRLRLARADGR
jgi:hypothetical protein